MGNRQQNAALHSHNGNEHAAFACFCISDQEAQEFSKFHQEESDWEDEVIPWDHASSIDVATHGALASPRPQIQVAKASPTTRNVLLSPSSPLVSQKLAALEEEKQEDIDGENEDEEEDSPSNESVLTAISPTKERQSRRPKPLSLSHPSATDLPANQADTPLTATVQLASPASVIKELEARDILPADLIWKDTGYNLLHAAVQAERPDLLELALSFGVDAFAKDNVSHY